MIKKVVFWGSFFLVFFVFICNLWIKQFAKNYTFEDVSTIPNNKVALVLGTNPITANYYLNPYFENRMDAAALLFDKDKVKHFILSGDNSRKDYNEPEEMKKALIKRGVPAAAITLDCAGFRTLDSVVRCDKVFQQSQFTIISQKFHNERAVFLARKKGLKAIAFNAENAFSHQNSKTMFREYLARCKAIIDLYILKKQPKYLGQTVIIKF